MYGFFVRMPAAAAALTAFLSPALAQAGAGNDRYGYGHPMMWGDGGWSMFFFGPLFMIAFLALIVVTVVLLFRWLGGATLSGPTQIPPPSRALDILKERFARGEIDKTEFEERRRTLGE